MRTRFCGFVPLLVAVPLAAGQQVLINEVDADTDNGDDMEFVELYDGGVGGTPLDGLVVVFFNGGDDKSYRIDTPTGQVDAFDLDGYTTDANGYFVIGPSGVPSVGIVINENEIDDGADAVALYWGNATDFPDNTPVTTVNLVDALVYDTDDSDDTGLLVLLNPGQPQVNERALGNGKTFSNQRLPAGSGGARNTDSYTQALATPGGPPRCETLVDDELESASGWTVGFPGDTATTGIWERVDPVGTAAQPEDDHTPTGVNCYVTGQHPGGEIGVNDVDGGSTTLLTPLIDLSGVTDPYISYWRWYSNDLGTNRDDVFEVLATDDGSTWVRVELLGPTGTGTTGGWIQHEFRVLDLPGFQLTDQVRLRFVASDLGGGSIVEAAIDDLEVFDVGCNSPPPVAEFSGAPTSGVAPLAVAFSDLSSGSVTSWSWSFGDGGTSTQQNPSHTYTLSGSYTVALTVTGPGGSDTETRASYVTVAAAQPAAEFSGTPLSGTAPLSTTFTDLSSGEITSWSWDFGDGGTSTLQNPSHTYTLSGSYTVALTVTGPGGSDTETRASYVTVAAAQPAAEFSGTPLSGTAPLSTTFTDLSSGEITSWSWDFGDGGTSTLQNPSHTYTLSGSYTVALTVTGPGGSDTETRASYVTVAAAQPAAEFSGTPLSGTAPLSTTFTDLSSGEITSWSWSFGDGGTSTLQNPSHTYATSGSYTVALTVTGPGGSDIETKTDYVTVAATAPAAEFSGTPLSGTAPLSTTFTDLSSGEITSWSWSFGDGATSTLQNPNHTYATSGSYTVALTVTGPGGSDVETKTDYVTVAAAQPVAEFSGTPLSGTAPLTTTFTDLSSGEITSWSWSFGDGATSTLQNPSHTYTIDGDYTVALTVTGPGGSDTRTQLDYVQVTPTALSTNVLLIIIDDIGVDRIAAYAEHPDPGRTPNIDSLAAEGVLFRNCWSNPLCSPTRATIFTGRYSFRTGVGTALIEDGSGTPLSLDELTIPEALPSHANALLGKWHLGHYPLHANDSGFEHFAGSLYNLDRLMTGASYTLWTKTIDGVDMVTTTYATTDTSDETIDAVQTLAEPWFVVSSFNAAHTPIHAPPSHLHTYNLTGDPLDDQPLFTRAMIEAMDTEIGRVLAALPPDVTVILVGDNGTGGNAADPPTIPGRSKGTVYEGGVRVPLIVKGPGVTQGECTSIVNTTDLFATIVELGGGSATAEDSISIVPYLDDPAHPPLREWVYAEKFASPFHLRAVREARYKLIQDQTATDYTELLYDLEADPSELTNLLDGTLTPEQEEAYRRLTCTIPLPLDAQSYCPAVPNSTGAPATIGLSGSGRIATGVLCLVASDMPPGLPGYFIASASQGLVPTPGGSAGNLCLGGHLRRFAGDVRIVDPQGSFVLEVDPGALPVDPPLAILPGETWNFQAWFRDPLPITTSNFTDGVSLAFE